MKFCNGMGHEKARGKRQAAELPKAPWPERQISPYCRLLHPFALKKVVSRRFWAEEYLTEEWEKAFQGSFPCPTFPSVSLSIFCKVLRDDQLANLSNSLISMIIRDSSTLFKASAVVKLVNLSTAQSNPVKP